MPNMTPEAAENNDTLAAICKAVATCTTQNEIAKRLNMPLGTLTGLLCGYDQIPAWFCVALARACNDSRPIDALHEMAGVKPRITTPSIARENMRDTNTAAAEFINLLDVALEDGRIDDAERAACLKAATKLQSKVSRNVQNVESLHHAPVSAERRFA